MLSPSLRRSTPAPSSLMSPFVSVGYLFGASGLLKMSSSCGTAPKFEIVKVVFPALRVAGAMTFHSYRLMVGAAASAVGVAATAVGLAATAGVAVAVTGDAVAVTMDAVGGALLTAGGADTGAAALEHAAIAPAMMKATITTRIGCTMAPLAE